MESPMLKMIKLQNPDKEYPSNLGKKWSNEEEILLLEELNNNIDIGIIAQKHNRTKGGIYSRQQHIAYKMYLKNISIEEIMEKTKLDEKCIIKIVEKKENVKRSKIMKTNKQLLTLNNEIKEESITDEIKRLELRINELKNIQKVDDNKSMLKKLYDYNLMVIKDMLDKNKKTYEECINNDKNIGKYYYLHNIIKYLNAIYEQNNTLIKI